MGRPKKKTKKLQKVKKAKATSLDTIDEMESAVDTDDAGASAELRVPKPLRLKLLPPKKLRSPSHKSEHDRSESEPITPPPPVAPEVLKEALGKYLRSRGRSVPLVRFTRGRGKPPKVRVVYKAFKGEYLWIYLPRSRDDEEDTDDSETELLLQGKRRIFEDGVMDETGVAEDEDELESSEEEFEGDEEESAKSETEPGSPVVEEPSVPAPAEGKKKKKEVSLKFSVPVNGANMTLTVLSTIPFTDLFTQLANTMSVAPNKVRVAYRFSIQNCSDPFNHLATNDHWDGLIADARRARQTTKSKKDFIVELKDLQVVPAGKGKKGAASKGPEKKKRKRTKSDSSDESAGSGEEGGPKKLSGPQWVAKLEAANACKEHGSACIKYVMGHICLSKAELTTWSIFMINGYASETTPPPTLKLGNAKKSDTPATAPAAPPAQAVNPLMPSMLPYAMPPFPWWPGSGGPYQTPAPPPKARYDDIPSSDPIDGVEEVTLFPRIDNWLQELDASPRGQDNHDFSQFMTDFEREKYMRIIDLVDLEVSDLKALIPDIAQGTALKLLSYAKKDVDIIRRKEKRRVKPFRPSVQPMLRVTQGVHFFKCSILGNHGKITIKGNPGLAGREILPLFSLFEPQNLDVTVTNVASVQFIGPRYALREHSVEMLQ
ncbi:hypothetical protein B0H12DRAFT_1082511 [Mycena haematopus]|nr:hypothetical protein B0H12DRAFT_1082511 [Mycena haematopus]